MNYQETLDYLYGMLPMYQRIGQAAFKKDLGNTIKLCQALENPQHKFKSVHIAGTNGKGSSAHAIAAVLQAAGYKTGLYTSPHLKNFTERIRVNGQEIPPQEIVAWVAENKALIEEVKPSFFELTVALAFHYFARQQVDVAVIEVGMGGRLDSTNVIKPEVSLITNIGLDHTAILGDTLPAIAAEKAGIIKKGVPVVIGEKQDETSPVFEQKALLEQAPLLYAADEFQLEKESPTGIRIRHKAMPFLEKLTPDIAAAYFLQNIPGILASLQLLQEKGFKSINKESIKTGLENVKALTGLKGRWQVIDEDPHVIADVSHNPDGIRQLLRQLQAADYQQLFMIIGTVNDKDINTVLSLLPKKAFYYFCQADIPRALAAENLQEQAKPHGLNGKVVHNVNIALKDARSRATENDLILITGSTFVVAEIDEL
jgi:dihydrofolate synthase/folylpolyglutamate synthase